MQAYDNDVCDDAALCVLAEDAFARSRAACVPQLGGSSST
jgi:hypothetical protein